MRIRITDNEVPYYTKAEREHTVVRVQGRDCRVAGVTANIIAGQRHWWVELVEV